MTVGKSSLPPSAKGGQAKYRVGVIGGGRKGMQHAQAYALNPLTEVVAIADTDPENLELFAGRFDVPGYSDYEEMLRKESIDIAAPVLPVSVNPEVVIGCARAGVKAIFSEKPASASLEDADRMVEECRSRGIPLACGDAWRNLPQFWKAKEMIDSGELGEVVSINVHHPTTEISGGGCQSLSVMRLFSGDAEIDWVVGWTEGDPFSDADQGMGGIVRFSNGIDGYYRSQRAVKSGIEVVTTKAVFYSDWTGFRLSKVRDGVELARARWSDFEEVEGLFPATQGWGGSFEKNWTHMSTRQEESVQSIVDALEKGIEPRCNGDNMRNVLELGIAFRESHRRGHAPIKMPMEDRSLKIMPHDSRWLNKKPLFGKERYAREIG